MANSRLEERVTRAAEAVLAEQNYVSAIDVLLRLGWLAQSHVDQWRQGRVECLERMVQASLGKQSTAMRTLRGWARQRGLKPSETAYVARSRDRRRLRFSVSGEPAIELACRTHWLSPELSARKAERLQAAVNRPPDLVVVSPLKDWTCGGCSTISNDLLLMQDDAALCLRCARLDHLTFLPAGDATRTRRAHRESSLTAVVVRFSRSRKRYERHGLLVEPDALDRTDAAMGAEVGAATARRSGQQVSDRLPLHERSAGGGGDGPGERQAASTCGRRPRGEAERQLGEAPRLP